MKNKKLFQKYIESVFIKNLLLITGTVFALLFFSGFVTIYQIVQDEKFSSGVHIDTIDVSGMSYDEAAQAVAANLEKLLSNIHISLVYTGDTVVLDACDMGVSFNQKEVLNEAYYYNKNENDSYAERYNKTVTLSNGINFETKMIIDEKKLGETVEQYAALYYGDPNDATVLFNKDTCQFTYTKEQYGTKIDTDDLVIKITDMLNKGDYSVLQVNSQLISPVITLSTLKENTAPITSYETTAYYNKNRNTNIQLICDAIDGIEIKPAEILSLNELTGERTEEKGYKAAPAIIHGVLIDDIGGGVCQLAGTLYNAAILANLEVVERVSHTWPSSYLPIGQDATINWNNKDLKIKNTTDYSIYISAKFEDQKVMVKIYGQPLEDDVTIEIENDTIQEIPPDGTEIRYTSELPPGIRKTVRDKKPGYIVKVYRVYLKNGIELGREVISWDTYPAMNKIVLVGTDNQDK